MNHGKDIQTDIILVVVVVVFNGSFDEPHMSKTYETPSIIMKYFLKKKSKKGILL